MNSRIDRRHFLATSAAVAFGATGMASDDKPKLRKAVKYGMIKDGKTVLEKFQILKSAGFAGVEMDSPADIDRAEVVKARDESGIVIHGVVNSTHWGVRHSDPSPKVRALAMKDLETALRDCKQYGGDTVLLVPGAVRNKETENFDQVWERSTEQVRKAIPLAKQLNVKIAIEVVWNDFLTKPEQLIKYVDQFATPHVGAYFDCSNMIKYGVPPAEWIRQLGKRMLKFDFKGYSKTKQWVPIGEGDEDWPEIRKALAEIGYHTWATAEIGACNEKQLRECAAKMNEILGL
jgi:L-ribulose-5-phosphate 3-epimerase